MSHKRPNLSLNRTYILPLVVALPIFFFLFVITIGWTLTMIIEQEWTGSRAGNIWKALQDARETMWAFAFVGMVIGIVWAWIILLPVRKLKKQLNRLIEEGQTRPLELDPMSELSSLADSFNKMLQEASKGMPERAQAVMDTISSGIILMDPDGTITWANPLASRILETPPEKIKNKHCQSALERSPGLVSMIEKSLASQSDMPQECIEILDRSGNRKILGARLAWVRGSENEPVSLALSVLDMTRLESFSSGVHSAERLCSLSSVASGIAHEVRNPLSSIRGLAQLLQSADHVDSEKLKSYTRIIINEVDRVNRVIDRLSLLVSAQEEIRSVTPVAKIIEPLIEMASHLSRKHHVTLQVQQEDDDIQAWLRPHHITQAILNVVINAIEASPPNDSIIIKTRREGDATLVVEVENHGAPIPPGELDDMFLPFHTTKDHRTGLGLTITDAIVREHGGRIEVQSGVSRTVFLIFLPLFPKETAEDSADTSADPVQKGR